MHRQLFMIHLGSPLIQLAASGGTAAFATRYADMRACRIKTSSIIDRVTFDDDARVLSVSFKQTGKYVYFDVPDTIFEALCRATSAGTFFNEQIKGRFACRRDPERRRFGPNA